ncbi:hypothetical protein KA005_23990 [bacterium]|nr:hypothetical protein [bacterium]
MASLLNDLTSPTEDIRKKTIDEIYGLVSANPIELTPHMLCVKTVEKKTHQSIQKTDLLPVNNTKDNGQRN